MRVHVAKDTVEALEESVKTLTGADLEQVLDALEHAADMQEAAWGPAELFVEVTLSPQGNERRTQLDMLLCFRDRAALIEMKRRFLKGHVLKTTLAQVTEQLKALRRRAESAGCGKDSIVPVLFLPTAIREELDALRDELDTIQYRHFLVAGADPHSRYLPAVCMEGLAAKGAPSGQSAGQLISVIRKSIGQEMWPTFPSVAHARRLLSELPSSVPDEISHDTWHIAALRADEVIQGAQRIDMHGVLEVVGPPGSGRSAYVRDLAAHLNREQGRTLLEMPIRQVSRPEDVLRTIWMELTGEDSALGVDALLGRLRRKRVICWIRSYDPDSVIALSEIAARARAIHEAPGEVSAARWVFDSLQPALCAQDSVIELRPFTTTELFAILQQVGPSRVLGRDPNEVVAQANGLPGLAVRLWQARSLTRAGRSGSVYGVFEEQLEPLELHALPFVALTGAYSPLGASVSLVRRWVVGAIPSLSSKEATAAVDGLIERLADWAFLRIDSPPKSELDAFTAGTVHGVSAPAFLSWRDLNFLEHVLDRAGSEWRDRRLLDLQGHLLAQSSATGDLMDVTLALQLGDLRPFLNSSFRHTHWRQCLQWVGGRGLPAFEKQPEQLELIRILRLFAELSTAGAEPQLAAEDMDKATPSTKLTERMLLLLRARDRGSRRHAPEALHRWAAENVRVSDADVRSEIAVRIADAYQRANFPLLAFESLWGAYSDQAPVSISTRGLVLFNVLAILNRRHLLGIEKTTGVNPNKVLVQVSSELATLALRDENVVSLANALFYRCRNDIQTRAGSAPRESLRHLASLEFIERVAPMRRLQALLTQASVHRHVCTNGRPSWPEYCQRATAAASALRRAHISAIQRSSTSHLLNATSYLLEVFACGLRFAAEPGARSVLVALGRDAAAMAEETRVRLGALQMLPGDEQQILLQVNLYYPLAAILRECRHSQWPDNIEERLRQPIVDLMRGLETLAREDSRPAAVKVRKTLGVYVECLYAMRAFGTWHELKKAGVVVACGLMSKTVAKRQWKDQGIYKLCKTVDEQIAIP